MLLWFRIFYKYVKNQSSQAVLISIKRETRLKLIEKKRTVGIFDTG